MDIALYIISNQQLRIKINTKIITINDSNLRPNKWAFGRVVILFRITIGYIRVTLKTKNVYQAPHYQQHHHQQLNKVYKKGFRRRESLILKVSLKYLRNFCNHLKMDFHCYVRLIQLQLEILELENNTKLLPLWHALR